MIYVKLTYLHGTRALALRKRYIFILFELYLFISIHGVQYYTSVNSKIAHPLIFEKGIEIDRPL
jgi:hypothetical protein